MNHCCLSEFLEDFFLVLLGYSDTCILDIESDTVIAVIIFKENIYKNMTLLGKVNRVIYKIG